MYYSIKIYDQTLMESEYARVESSTNDRETAFQIDSQVVKTHYPRDNNEKILTFVIQEDPNLALDFSSISLSFSVEIPSNRLPENGFAAKMFRAMNIEINAQLITNTKSL